MQSCSVLLFLNDEVGACASLQLLGVTRQIVLSADFELAVGGTRGGGGEVLRDTDHLCSGCRPAGSTRSGRPLHGEGLWYVVHHYLPDRTCVTRTRTIVSGWLFDAQVISFSTQERDACIDRMISAIRRAIEHCRTHDTLTASTKAKKPEKQQKTEQATDVHESDAPDVVGLESQLKEAVLAAFSSTRAAFDAHSKNGVMGKKEWKKLIKNAMPLLKQEPSKLLRKRLPNRMSWADFSAVFDGPRQRASSTGKKNVKATADEAEAALSEMAALPPEVPEVRLFFSFLRVDEM